MKHFTCTEVQFTSSVGLETKMPLIFESHVNFVANFV